MNLEPYHATDRRVYNGALCSDMLRERHRTDVLLAYLQRLEPNARTCYFPVEGKWNVWNRETLRDMIPELVYGQQEAIVEAIQHLEALLERVENDG